MRRQVDLGDVPRPDVVKLVLLVESDHLLLVLNEAECRRERKRDQHRAHAHLQVHDLAVGGRPVLGLAKFPSGLLEHDFGFRALGARRGDGGEFPLAPGRQLLPGLVLDRLRTDQFAFQPVLPGQGIFPVELRTGPRCKQGLMFLEALAGKR
ncbi:hypothetical protein D9M72_294130 [compost metagenome]